MGQALSIDTISVEEYLSGEQVAEVRSEYVDGQVYAMVGVSENHATIAGELFAAIHRNLPQGCHVWQSDLKVGIKVGLSEFFYYPDIMFACGKNQVDPYYRTNPRFIAEILSPSTMRIDLHEKFEHYRQIPSLEEYLVVFQDRPQVRLFRRDDGWRGVDCVEGALVLRSVGLTLPVEQLYRDIELE